MKAWMTTLAVFLGLGAATAWSADPVPLVPVPATTGPSCGAACGSCGPAVRTCGTCNSCCQRGGNLLDWLLFCPNKTPCRGICAVPRNPPPYAFFYTFPHYERAPGCAGPVPVCNTFNFGLGHGCKSACGTSTGCGTGGCAGPEAAPVKVMPPAQ